MMHEIALGKKRKITYPSELGKFVENFLTQASDLPIYPWSLRPQKGRKEVANESIKI